MRVQYLDREKIKLHAVGREATEGPWWGHPMLVLGALCSFLEPFCGHLSPKIDKVSEESTLRYPHVEPCEVDGQPGEALLAEADYPTPKSLPNPQKLKTLGPHKILCGGISKVNFGIFC